jgi:hypothetical protein
MQPKGAAADFSHLDAQEMRAVRACTRYRVVLTVCT